MRHKLHGGASCPPQQIEEKLSQLLFFPKTIISGVLFPLSGIHSYLQLLLELRGSF